MQAPRPLAAGGSSLAAQLGGWAFTTRVYIAFDGPNVTLPNWLDVTPFVEVDSISISHGRPDGISDVQVGTCSLKVNNMDGRWTSGNKSGPWAGLVRKGIWLRVDLIPLSGIVSRRYTGFINALPTTWAGLYASAAITASDRFLKLGQGATLPAMTSAEVVYDSSTGPLVAAHYPLTENAAGGGFALAFGDITGNVSPPLHPVPWGSNQASYLNFLKPQGASAPGYDGSQCVSFAPSSINVGTVLETPLAPWNTYNGFSSYGVLELWLQTTFENTFQAFASLYDPASGCAVAFAIDGATGYLVIDTGSVTAGGTFAAGNTVGPLTPAAGQSAVVLNDGNWHYISIATAVGPTAINPLFVVNIDGKTAFIGAPPNNVSPNMNTLIIGGTPAAASAGSYICFTGNIANVSWILSGNAASNYPAHYQGGYQGFIGEYVDQRIARIARYAGIPQPNSLQVPAVGFNSVPVYNRQYGPWTNLAPCIHQVGTQSIVGRQALDVMREAARTEQMPLYIDRYGYLTIQPISARLNTPVSWVVNALDLDPSTTPTDDYTYLVNQVSVTPNGGATQVVNGPAGLASQDQDGFYNQGLQTASINSTDAVNAALNMIGHNSDPTPRLAPMVIEAATLALQQPATVPAAIGVSNDYGLPIYLISSATAFYGGQVYQVTVPAGSGQYTTIVTLSTPVTAGDPYSFQGRFTIPAGAAVATDVGMIFTDVNGTITGYGGGGSATPIVGATTFTEITGEGNAPAGSVMVQLKVEVAAPAGVPMATTWQVTALQFEQNNVSTTWSIPGPGSPNLLTVDQATAGQGTPYEASSIYGAAWYDALLASEISTVAQVVNMPPQAPAPWLNVFLEGWTETIGAGTHTFAFNCSPQTDGSVLQLDTPGSTLDTPAITLGY